MVCQIWKLKVAKLINDIRQTKLTLVLPAYQKGNTIVQTIERIANAFDQKVDYEIIVVIDGDVDNTNELIRNMKDPKVRIIQRSKNGGKGVALRDGVRAAGPSHWLGYLDADLDLHPDGIIYGISRLMENPNLDFAIGSKFHSDSEILYPLSRVILSKLFIKLNKILFQIEVQDTQTGLKVGNFECFKECMLETSVDDFCVDLEFLILAQQKKLTFLEIPVQLNYAFNSTVNKGAVLRMLKYLLSTFAKKFH